MKTSITFSKSFNIHLTLKNSFPGQKFNFIDKRKLSALPIQSIYQINENCAPGDGIFSKMQGTSYILDLKCSYQYTKLEKKLLGPSNIIFHEIFTEKYGKIVNFLKLLKNLDKKSYVSSIKNTRNELRGQVLLFLSPLTYI